MHVNRTYTADDLFRKKERNNYMKKILIFSLAVMMLFGSTITANAAVCDNAPDGVHHFNRCKRSSDTFELPSIHTYVFAVDDNGLATLRSCNVVSTYVYCDYECSYCGLLNPIGKRHSHKIAENHSEKH